MSVTHLSTIEASVRSIANKCDLAGANLEFFLKGTFITDIAVLIQQYEEIAYMRGVNEGRLSDQRKFATHPKLPLSDLPA